MWSGALVLAFLAGVCVGSGTEPETDPAPPDAAPTISTSTSATSTTTTTTASAVSTTRASPTTTTVPVAPTTSDPAPPDTLPPGWSAGEVADVVDGDTFHVRLDDGPEETVRLIGTNSPEGGECYAAEATAGLRDLILGGPVHLEPDTSDRDQFGRLLRYVWTPDGVFVNASTVAQGLAIARDYPPDTARSAELHAAQERAQASGAGLWAPDACGESVPADVQIAHVEYDAPGDDNINQNGEWVEISNGDDVAVDLTGWVLKDESASHRYRFPDGFTLNPGATVRVFTGCGQDTADALFWCVSGSAVWNNSGDTAFLLDPDGNIVYSHAYG